MKMKIHSAKMRLPLALIAIACLALLLAPSAGARTWTSADGTRTFEAELQSYDAASGEVRVILLPNRKRMMFMQEKLSADDLAWLKKNAGKP
ncbi:MAG: hypothetical protein ACI9NC_004663, partial [Verrucomicrobiales bacterium]